MATSKKEIKKYKETVGHNVHWLYVFFLILSVGLIIRLFCLLLFFKPDPTVEKALSPAVYRQTIPAHRGTILSDDGEVLAISLPIYDIHIDCTVNKDSWAKLKNREKGDRKEASWRERVPLMAKGLDSLLGKNTASETSRRIISLRDHGGPGSKYYPLATRISHTQLLEMKKLPLFDLPRGEGGVIVEAQNIRKYPYGYLARRTIGFVKEGDTTSRRTVGIEGNYDGQLRGEDGLEYMRVSDGKRKVHNNDSSYVGAVDGLDVRTTLDIKLQDIADQALRERTEGVEPIEGACLVVMDVHTGAIKVMVNLVRDSVSRRMAEGQKNLAMSHRNEPGSVMKTVMLLSCIADGYIDSLDQTMPTHHGIIAHSEIHQDTHILDYENRHHTNVISILDGFKISSNYVFATLAIKNYSQNPGRLLDNIDSWKFARAFDFDISGMSTPTLPRAKGMDNTTLGTLGYGYAMELAPIHILNFYNTIAGKGKMMKPYLVQSLEREGEIVEKYEPVVLGENLFSEAVADTVTRALKAVTEDGTARVLKNAKCSVAGKTGTAYGHSGGYSNGSGTHIYNATFVGFFPADDPQYSIICCTFSRPTSMNLVGGAIPASTVKVVVDKMYEYGDISGKPLEKGAEFTLKAKKRK